MFSMPVLILIAWHCSLVTLKGGISDVELAVQPNLVFTHLTRCHILQSSMSFLIGSWAVFDLPFPIFRSNFPSDGNDNNQAKLYQVLFYSDKMILLIPKSAPNSEVRPKKQIPYQHDKSPFDKNSSHLVLTLKSRYESVDNWHPPISHQDHRAVPVLLPRPRPQSGSACRESWTAY